MSFRLQASAAGAPVLALGADLSAEQKAAVLAEMGISEEEAASYETIYITNDMEHQYLDASLGASVVGTHSLSSVLSRAWCGLKCGDTQY